MARPLRIEFEGAWYHVMNRGAGRRLVFRSSADRAVFLRLLGNVSRIYGVEIHAYCLMGNHYHLLVCTPTAGLGRAMRHLNGVYTQSFNRRAQTDGPLFRGRYRSVLINEDSHLGRVSRYIHLNPVEADLVTHPEDYTASSYRAFLRLDRSPSWLHTEETLSRFGPGNARHEYRRFVQSGIDGETREFYGKARLGPILGDSDFRERIDERVQAEGIGSDPERPAGRTLTERPALEVIAAVVCRVFEVSLGDLRPASKRHQVSSAARGALIHLGREIGGHPLRAISSWIGYRSYAGASKAMSRFRATITKNPDARRRLEAARRKLSKRRKSRSMYQAKT